MKTLLINARIPDEAPGSLKDCSILVEQERIARIDTVIEGADRVIDLHGHLVIPGMIDPHVHARDLGQAAKEDWSSANAAALAGGVTTFFDMPNTLPPTVDEAGLDAKRAAVAQAAAKCREAGIPMVRHRLFVGAAPHHFKDLRAVLKSKPADVSGVKVFLAASSSNEVLADRVELHDIFSLAADMGYPVAVHAELQSIIEKASPHSLPPNGSPLLHNRFRPREAAIAATALACELARSSGARLYVCHVSTPDELDIITGYRDRADVHAEACPHHLFLDDAGCEALGSHAKVNPPIRGAMDAHALRQVLGGPAIDAIGSDHAPHTLAEKAKPFFEAPSGFPGMETSLALLVDYLQGGPQNAAFDLQTLCRLTSSNAARIFGLTDQGTIAEGMLADFAVIDPNALWTVEPEKFHTKAKYSPWAGTSLRGQVVASIVGGHYHPNKEKP